MTANRGSTTGSIALRKNIREVETRIRRRQGAIGGVLGGALGGAAREIRGRMLSPAAIIGAGLLGAVIQRGRWLHGERVLSILQTTNTGLRLLLTLAPEARQGLRNPDRTTPPRE